MATIIVEVEIENSGPGAITRMMPRGSVIEVEDRRARAQDVTLAREYTVTLPAHGKTTMYFEAYCLERWKSWPQGAKGRMTPFAYQGPYFDQGDLWEEIDLNPDM